MGEALIVRRGGGVKEITSWGAVQQIVRNGEASKLLKVGVQLTSSYDGGNIIWEVIGINQETPTDAKFTRSLTLQTQKILLNTPFDAAEPTNPDSNRKTYGNNRYIHSNIRQWLNSYDANFDWQSQHQYDAPPTGEPYTGAGFLYRLDPELVAVLGFVDKKVAQANVDGGGQDSFSDRVFLLSEKEVGLDPAGVTTGEVVYSYYNSVADSKRIKQQGTNSAYWRLRSLILLTDSYRTRVVSHLGTKANQDAYISTGIAPACVIY